MTRCPFHQRIPVGLNDAFVKVCDACRLRLWKKRVGAK